MTEAGMNKRPKYTPGDRVWLAEFRDREVFFPRVEATIISADVHEWGISYVVEVEPEEEGDDGLRELTEDQIEDRKYKE